MVFIIYMNTELSNKYFMYKSCHRSLSLCTESLPSFRRLLLQHNTIISSRNTFSSHLIALLRRRSISLVLIVLLLVLRRRTALDLCWVRSLTWRRRSVVLLELHGVLRVELSLLLEPAVILLLVLGVLCWVHRRLGRARAVLVVVRGSATSVVRHGVTSGNLITTIIVISSEFRRLRRQFCLKSL